MKGQFQGMLDAWSRGDVAGIAKSFNADMGEAPELMDVLSRAATPTGRIGSRDGSTSRAPS